MSRHGVAAVVPGASAQRTARVAERILRVLAEPRLGLGLLLVAGAANAVAAALPAGPAALDTAPYALLLGAILLSGLAAVAVRLPAAWREWRRPGPVAEGQETLAASVRWLEAPADESARQRVEAALRDAGYRVRTVGSGARWTLHGTRRGWSRFAGIGTHLAISLVVVGAAVGAAFGSEKTFSLLPGDQAFLDVPRPGFTDAVRLERFDAEFGTDGRPSRLDTHVTFLRDGRPVRSETLQVNRPGDFGGYLVHGWTYGPAASVRVETLGGRPLVDADVPLDAERGGRPFAFVEVPAAGLTLGVQLADADANRISLTAAGPSGVVDVAALSPGEEARLGDVIVRLDGFAAYVTFLSRRDPGAPVLFAGAGLLTAGLAVGLWLPRRRLTLRWSSGTLRVTLRGERFDQPAGELERILPRLEAAR
jgi:cytochrome c biogenesis protein